MTRFLFGFGLALVALATASTRVDAQGVEGTWRVTYVTGGTTENTYGIVKLSVKDGKTTGELVAARVVQKNSSQLKSVSQDGANLRVVLTFTKTDLAFEAAIPKQVGKTLPGVMEINGNLSPAMLVATEETTLDARSAVRLVDCPPMQQARTLSTKPATLRFQANQTKDAEKKKALLEQVAEAERIANAETPKHYREVLDKYADSPAAIEASLNLIRAAKASAANPGDIKAWAAAGASTAKKFGPRLETDYASQVAGALLTVAGAEKVAVEYARLAEKSLTDKTPAADQVKVLGMLSRALKKAGQEADAKALTTRVDQLELVLDKEYSTKMPGFKGTVYEGRKAKSDRAVFMELFTGATCPPCVAADLAFDVLQHTYKKNELVLIQYHMHIPGPDPMTNLDTIARWDYYREKYPMQVRGVPSSIFNGKPQGGGGGGVDNAEPKYNAYRDIIDPLLEENGGAKLAAEARRNGDRIDINVKVSDLNEPGADKKLRILLAEETVRYAGSNKIRLHHNVVRAFPGGVAGTALKDAASRHQASINLGELRSSLTKYLDDYEANVRAFANPARPMAMTNLRVIAFVQDDNTREILQAVQVAVESK